MSAITQRRWHAFFRQGRARFGLAGLGLLLFFSLTTEFWSHERPFLLVRKDAAGASHVYFPALLSYSAADFGITDSFDVDFKALVARESVGGTWAWFPVNPWDPYVLTPEVLAPPSRAHWLGTDGLGRDVAARLIYGVRVSLAYGMLFWFFSFLIGIFLGSIQGYVVGRFDFFLERFKELTEIIPFLSVVMLVNGLIHSTAFSGFWVTLLIVVALSWISIASQVRAQFLALRRREFCEAAVAVGASDLRIIFVHILPNALTPVLTLSPFAISAGIGTLAVLDYLGFGLNPPTPSLGELLAQGRAYSTQAPWLLIAPTAALAVMLIAINLIGESLRQAFDPRKG